MPESWGQNLQNNLNIDEQIIPNLAHLLYSMSFELIYPGIRSHPGCPHQDLFPIIMLGNEIQPVGHGIHTCRSIGFLRAHRPLTVPLAGRQPPPARRGVRCGGKVGRGEGGGGDQPVSEDPLHLT